MATARNDERTASDPLRPEGVREVPVAEPRGLPQARPPAEGSRLPKHIVGGFQGIGDDLERRSRESASMVRLLEQHRLFLESAERERDLLNERLGAIVPEVQESGRALKAMLDASRSGDISGDLAALFDRSMRALDELEKTGTALSVNFLLCRSAWEQYARSVIRAQQMRDEHRQPAR